MQNLFFLLALFCEIVHCHKILVYTPRIAFSHVAFMNKIADVLQEAGHNVYVLSPKFHPQLDKIRPELANVIEKTITPPKDSQFQDAEKILWLEQGESVRRIYSLFKTIIASENAICKDVFEDRELIERLKNENFDMGISEVISLCGFGIFDKININLTAGALAVNLLETLSDVYGYTSNPSYVPAIFSPNSDIMTYGERAQNLLIYSISHLFKTFSAFKMGSMQHYMPHFDAMEALRKNSFLFVNAEEYLDFPRQISHKVVYVSGIARSEARPLNNDFMEIVNSAPESVVLISFGTIAKSNSMTKEMKKAFVDAIKEFPQIRFIVKYNEENDSTFETPNLKKRNWIPQNDLLQHPKVTAFITHGGLNSITESVYAGVPMICIPLFADQMRNAKMIEKRHVAVIINKANITSESLTWAIRTIIHDKSYYKSSQQLSRMIRKKPMSAKERLTKHIEFALEFGQTDNLDYAGAHLNIIQFYLLDLLVPLFALISFTFYFYLKFVIYLIRKCCRKAKTKRD